MSRYIEDDVHDEIEWLLRKEKDKPTIHSGMVEQVCATKKFRGMTARELAMIVINRARTTKERLSHDTGAENWL